MIRMKFIPIKASFVLAFMLFSFNAKSQFDENKTGAWYMYFWNTTIKESAFGFQGDIQYRNWNILGDLEQLLLRGGFTWKPKETDVKLTLGYGHITTGAFGESNTTTQESRIYQEALIPQKIGSRIFLKHRFRFEQRFVENQILRTRYRYNLFLNIPFNQADLNKGAIYLALYNELFINGQRYIGNGNNVEIFDRNRLYGAIGYSITDNMKVQGGYMLQTTDNWSKGQIQLSLHHKF